IRRAADRSPRVCMCFSRRLKATFRSSGFPARAQPLRFLPLPVPVAPCRRLASREPVQVRAVALRLSGCPDGYCGLRRFLQPLLCIVLLLSVRVNSASVH
ncbi:MAG: hypothetical protein ACKPJJ_21530, partial [Planctomycetaceae bacterium]